MRGWLSGVCVCVVVVETKAEDHNNSLNHLHSLKCAGWASGVRRLQQRGRPRVEQLSWIWRQPTHRDTDVEDVLAVQRNLLGRSQEPKQLLDTTFHQVFTSLCLSQTASGRLVLSACCLGVCVGEEWAAIKWGTASKGRHTYSRSVRSYLRTQSLRASRKNDHVFFLNLSFLTSKPGFLWASNSFSCLVKLCALTYSLQILLWGHCAVKSTSKLKSISWQELDTEVIFRI